MAPAHLAAGIAALQAAAATPGWVRGVQVHNVSLRMLHHKKQASWQRPLVRALQRALRTTPLGRLFFSQVATQKVRTCQQHIELEPDTRAPPCRACAASCVRPMQTQAQ